MEVTVYTTPTCPWCAKTKEFLKVTTVHSYIPEPLRIAHIIAAGLVKGESRGRA